MWRHFNAVRILVALTLLGATGTAAPAPAPGPTGVLVVVGDQHSAYERAAQVLARIDRWRAANPKVPLAILIDGDAFEAGNVVARRSLGAIDFAMFGALARRAPTVLNVGNHEPEFYDLATTLAKISATGVSVVSNISDHRTGNLFTPASVPLQFGPVQAVVVGVTTDRLATFRLAVRPTLDLSDPVVWAKQNFTSLLAPAPVKIVLSHAGLNADRQMLPLVPDGTLFAGAHDHIRLVERIGHTVYIHSGSWNEYITFASFTLADGGPKWDVHQEKVETTDPADASLAKLIKNIQARHLTGEDTAVLGRLNRPLSPDEAARFVVRAVRVAAGADAAFVGHTTFGAGLPLGSVTRFALVACVRFDGPIYLGEMTGAQLSAVLAAANETADTPFAQRHGDYLVADGPAKIVPEQRYRVATTDWIAHNPKPYLGSADISFRENARLKLQAIAGEALNGVGKNLQASR